MGLFSKSTTNEPFQPFDATALDKLEQEINEVATLRMPPVALMPASTLPFQNFIMKMPPEGRA